MQQPLEDFITGNPVILAVFVITGIFFVMGLIFEMFWHRQFNPFKLCRLPKTLKVEKVLTTDTGEEVKETVHFCCVNKIVSRESFYKMEQNMSDYGSKLSAISASLDKLHHIMDYNQTPCGNRGKNNKRQLPLLQVKAIQPRCTNENGDIKSAKSNTCFKNQSKAQNTNSNDVIVPQVPVETQSQHNDESKQENANLPVKTQLENTNKYEDTQHQHKNVYAEIQHQIKQIIDETQNQQTLDGCKYGSIHKNVCQM